jgi:hypothetical protein
MVLFRQWNVTRSDLVRYGWCSCLSRLTRCSRRLLSSVGWRLLRDSAVMSFRFPMRYCPHCGAPISLADLMSKRLLSARECHECGGGYIEGGTTVAVGLMAAAGALVTSLNSQPPQPQWLFWAIIGCAGVLANASVAISRPRKSEEWRSRLLEAMVYALVVPMVVWGAIGVFGFVQR